MTAKFVSKKDVFCASGTIRSVYEKRKNWVKTDKTHCLKSVCIRSYSGPHFPAFGLNTSRYGGDQDLVPAPFHLINFCQHCRNSFSLFHIFFDIKAPNIPTGCQVKFHFAFDWDLRQNVGSKLTVTFHSK